MICYECSGRHRSYGNTISFIRSIDLDTWKRYQLKAMELAGNKYAKEKFTQLGVPKVSGIFDYNSDKLNKYRTELNNKAKSYFVGTTTDKNPIMPKSNSVTIGNNSKESFSNQVNFDDIFNNNELFPSENPTKKEELKVAKKFSGFGDFEAEDPTSKSKGSNDVTSTSNSNYNRSIGNKSNKGKIKKIDVNFDFDNFNETNFTEIVSTDVKNVNKTEKSKRKNEDSDDDEVSKVIDKNSGNNNEKKGNTNYSKTNNSLSQDEINKHFANKKAISSEDFENL